MKPDVKEKLLKATVKLLQSEKEPESITAREIATAAGANLAMINYYYKSKDELVYLAVGELMREEIDAWVSDRAENMSAYQRLRQMLIALCDITVKYSQYTSLSAEYEIIKADIRLPQYILPLIREICGNERSEISMRITAYEIISVLQLVYLRAKDFWSYAGVNIMEHDDRVQAINTLLESHFPEGEKNEIV